MHAAVRHDLFDEFVAEALDVQRFARGEVDQRLYALRLAVQAAGAARHRFAFGADDFGGADWAVRRHGERLAVGGAFFQNDFDDFGDDVASAAHEDGIADANVLARHFVGVVQGGVGNGDAADFHRLQAGDGGNSAGAADLHVDGFDDGSFFHRREFPRHRPAWRTRDESGGLLFGETVSLIDDAVDFIRQVVAVRGHVRHVSGGSIRAGERALQRADGQSPGAVLREQFGVGRGQDKAVVCAVAVSEETELARSGDGGVKLAQAASGGVARVGKGLAATLQGLRVQRGKGRLRHIDFAAHFDDSGRGVAQEPQRDGADGAHISGHVLAGRAVATGRRTGQYAVFVTQADGEAVEFRLGGEMQWRVAIEALLQAAVEGGEILGVEDVIQRQHRHGVGDGGKSAVCLAADAAGGRIIGHRRAAGRFQCAQFLHQRVVFGIGNGRVIEDVVGVVVSADEGA